MNKLNKHQVFGGISLGYFSYLLLSKGSGYLTGSLLGGMGGFLKWLVILEIAALLILIVSSISVILEKPKHFVWLLVGFTVWLLYTIKDLYVAYTFSAGVHGDFEFSGKWQWFMNQGIINLIVFFYFLYCIRIIHMENELNKSLQPTSKPSASPRVRVG